MCSTNCQTCAPSAACEGYVNPLPSWKDQQGGMTPGDARQALIDNDKAEEKKTGWAWLLSILPFVI